MDDVRLCVRVLVNSRRIIRQRKMGENETWMESGSSESSSLLSSGPDKRIMARQGELTELAKSVLLASALH